MRVRILADLNFTFGLDEKIPLKTSSSKFESLIASLAKSSGLFLTSSSTVLDATRSPYYSLSHANRLYSLCSAMVGTSGFSSSIEGPETKIGNKIGFCFVTRAHMLRVYTYCCLKKTLQKVC